MRRDPLDIAFEPKVVEAAAAQTLLNERMVIPLGDLAAMSAAFSAKRGADALERIADALEVGNGLSMVIHDGELDGRPNAFVENVCSAISARLK